MNTIFVAEDNVVTSLLFKKYLETWQYNPKMFVDGQEAWEWVEPFLYVRPIFLITDLMMPKMDGLELCKKIRSTPYGSWSYLIMYTANEQSLALGNSLKLSSGVNEYLVKPVHATILKDKVITGYRIFTELSRNCDKMIATKNQEFINNTHKL